MTTNRRHLHAVEGSLRQVPEPRCSLAVQAVMAGPQEVRVTGTTAQASGRGYGHLCLRVGRILIYLEDRDSLRAWQHALQQAENLADAALGPELPEWRYRPDPRP